MKIIVSLHHVFIRLIQPYFDFVSNNYKNLIPTIYKRKKHYDLLNLEICFSLKTRVRRVRLGPGPDPDPSGSGSGSEISELCGSGSGPGLENFVDRTRNKKNLVEIIIFFEFFLIIDNETAIKQNKLYKNVLIIYLVFIKNITKSKPTND